MNYSIDNLRISLIGVAIGDAFGEQFFGREDLVTQQIKSKKLPAAPWEITDDTVMACGIATSLIQFGKIIEDQLALIFSRNYQDDPERGYGAGAHRILQSIDSGHSWETVSKAMFNGTGSMGNGSAMRVAPLGAYFFENPHLVMEEAKKSAQVTHWHPEGKMGAVAIALGAAWATRQRMKIDDKEDLFEFVLRYLPHSELKTLIHIAQKIPLDSDVEVAVEILGNGSNIIVRDTVPFTLWCASKYINNFSEALWNTVSGLGDCDTTCAIVGGIVAARNGIEGIEKYWIKSIEKLNNKFGWDEIFADTIESKG